MFLKGASIVRASGLHLGLHRVGVGYLWGFYFSSLSNRKKRYSP